MRTRLIVAMCFGVDHNASEGLHNFGEELSARETKLEEYIPRDSSLLAQITALLVKGTFDVLPHCAANQLDQRIWV